MVTEITTYYTSRDYFANGHRFAIFTPEPTSGSDIPTYNTASIKLPSTQLTHYYIYIDSATGVNDFSSDFRENCTRKIGRKGRGGLANDFSCVQGKCCSVIVKCSRDVATHGEITGVHFGAEEMLPDGAMGVQPRRGLGPKRPLDSNQSKSSRI